MLPSAAEVEEVARQRLVPIEEATARGDSEVQEFYHGAVVFVTGGSGFLGKHLIEKIFRTSDIKKLYILLRSKRGRSMDERLQRILDNPVYDTIRKTRPWFLERVEAVEGDITELKLGLADHVWDRVVDEVTVIYHSAATVSFADPLKVATNINVKGTLEMLTFGKACKNLKTYVHISTAYSQALHSRVNTDIPEQFSPAPMPPKTLIELAETLDQETLEDIFHRYLGRDYPNSYAYTKAVAEEAVRSMAGDLPICIVRPAIVIPAYSEPAAGWVDKNNVFGPSGIILGLGLGVIHTLISDPDIKIDLVPVDLVNNAVVVAGWETARRRGRGERDTRIYTTGSSYRNSITWQYLTNVLNHEARPRISPQARWYAYCVQFKSWYIFSVLSLLLHFIPGFLVDVGLVLSGREPMAIKIYNQLYKLSSVISYFTLRSWNFEDTNLLNMYKSLSKTDQQMFNLDIKSVDMKELIVLWHLGLRRFVLKDDFKNEEKAARKQLWLKIATYIITPIYFYALYKIFAFVVNILLFICSVFFY